ncbi:MAG: hypothetical protein NC395_10305 [Prevotella sp.]|nr:hypothetical protein [Prevotella sp.]
MYVNPATAELERTHFIWLYCVILVMAAKLFAALYAIYDVPGLNFSLAIHDNTS